MNIIVEQVKVNRESQIIRITEYYRRLCELKSRSFENSDVEKKSKYAEWSGRESSTHCESYSCNSYMYFGRFDRGLYTWCYSDEIQIEAINKFKIIKENNEGENTHEHN